MAKAGKAVEPTKEQLAKVPPADQQEALDAGFDAVSWYKEHGTKRKPPVHTGAKVARLGTVGEVLKAFNNGYRLKEVTVTRYSMVKEGGSPVSYSISKNKAKVARDAQEAAASKKAPEPPKAA